MTRLRLAIGSFDGSDSVVEVIDARGIHVAETSHDDPLVGVALARPASSSPEPLVGITAESDRDILIEALRQNMAEAPQRERSGEKLPGGDRHFSLCRLFKPPPWFC